ncbi:MAG TPA: formate dehydrogenase accessory sulfurtransferase FdhD [Ktedonobacteraceae bacterium]|nr:formate dehydrogenase accessory sulfurtransferase FdhD [Ktedonobacteraceae bacterium]
MAFPGSWRSPLDPERVMNTQVIRWQEGEQQQREEYLTIEDPCEIRLGGRSLAVIMRTPGHDFELVLGFLLTEGIIAQPEDVLAVRVACDAEGLPLANVVEVTLSAPVMERAAESAFQRNFAVSASCGLCGRDSIVDVLSMNEPLTADGLRILAPDLYRLPALLREAQAVFTHTGGLHAAGLFTIQGELTLLREDVGRHNAVDKLIGYGLLHHTLPYSRSILLVSGRTSFEIIQKALQARIPCIAAISAPSSLAVELAEQSGITLIGFLRERTMNIYSHPERIVPALRTLMDT